MGARPPNCLRTKRPRAATVNWSQRRDRLPLMRIINAFIITLLFAAASAGPTLVHARCNTVGLFDRMGQKYGLDPVLLYAISLVESGARPSAINKNSNGSIDHGAMQINSIHLPRLATIGIARKDLFDPCVSVDVGAWVLSQCFARWGVNWDGVGCYNSNTPKHRTAYAAKVHAKYASLLKHRTAPPARANAAPARYICVAAGGCEVIVMGSGGADRSTN
jgi:Transglycosylase SLT domain